MKEKISQKGLPMEEQPYKKRPSEEDQTGDYNMLNAVFGGSKLTKYDEALIAEVKVYQDRVQKELEERFRELHVPLVIPTQEELDIVLAFIQTNIVNTPGDVKMRFTHKTRESGVEFEIGCQTVPWLVRPMEWLRLYKEQIPEDSPSDREYAAKYIVDQLFAYFQSIADAWNARYTVAIIHPILDEAGCYFQIVKYPLLAQEARKK